MTLPEEIRHRLIAALDALDGVELPADFKPQVAATADPKFGDYQSNAAMLLAKLLKTNPRELAATIVDQLDLTGLCEPAEIAGPGFLNFRVENNVI